MQRYGGHVTARPGAYRVRVRVRQTDRQTEMPPFASDGRRFSSRRGPFPAVAPPRASVGATHSKAPSISSCELVRGLAVPPLPMLDRFGVAVYYGHLWGRPKRCRWGLGGGSPPPDQSTILELWFAPRLRACWGGRLRAIGATDWLAGSFLLRLCGPEKRGAFLRGFGFLAVPRNQKLSLHPSHER